MKWAILRASLLSSVVAYALLQFWRQSSTTCSNCTNHSHNNSTINGTFVDVQMSTVESSLALKYKLTRFEDENRNHHATITTITKALLMIPGHCGGHRQFTKMAQRMSQMDDNVVIYAIDHDGEYTGFHGQSLWEEAEFAADCIEYVKRRHKGNLGITIIGHSMGGIVGLAVAANISERKRAVKVDKLVTFATSHRKPPISLDPTLHSIYEKLSQTTTHRNVTVISVVNSERDLMVDLDMSVVDKGTNVHISDLFDCRPDHISILTCDCVIDNIDDIISGHYNDKHQKSQKTQTHRDWFSFMFRKFGVIMLAVGVQYALLAHTRHALDSSLSISHYIACSLHHKTMIGFGIIYALYGHVMFGQASVGLWAMACLGPNYLISVLLCGLARIISMWLPADEGKNCHDSFNTALVLLLTCAFAPFPYAVLIINMIIIGSLFKSRQFANVIPFHLLLYTQIIYAPSLLVWMKAVSRGWVSFADVDILRSAPLALFAYCLRSGRLVHSRNVIIPNIVFISLVLWFSEKETFRIVDAFAIYLTIIALMCQWEQYRHQNSPPNTALAR